MGRVDVVGRFHMPRGVHLLAMTVEYRFVELRRDGRRLSGVAVRYGDTATLPWGPERIAPGAFQPIGDVILNSHHDRTTPLARTGGGGLTLRDTAASLEVQAELPSTSAANDTLELVRSGVMRGLSIEFRAVSERLDGDVRVIERASLSGVAVVDKPAYPASLVEARGAWKKAIASGRNKPWGRSKIATGRTADCVCIKPIERVHFRDTAFDAVLSAIEERTHRIRATIGNFGAHNLLGDTVSGALKISRMDDGIRVLLSEAAKDTPAGRSLRASDSVAPVIVRPLVDVDRSDFTDVDGIRYYDLAWLSALLFKSAAGRAGWSGMQWYTESRAKPVASSLNDRDKVVAWL